MAGVVMIPWYATPFRADKLAVALEEIAPIALDYGASDYRIYRSRDDTYKFSHYVSFESKLDWEAYWYGEQFSAWRAVHQSWYTVPVVYVWHDIVTEGAAAVDPVVEADAI